MFCAPFCLPLPPTMPFGALVGEVLPGLYGYHPEFGRIDWQRTEWFKSGRRFRPDSGKSLEERPEAQGRDPLPHAGTERHQGQVRLSARPH